MLIILAAFVAEILVIALIQDFTSKPGDGDDYHYYKQ